jgi:hypothetical protein
MHYAMCIDDYGLSEVWVMSRYEGAGNCLQFDTHVCTHLCLLCIPQTSNYLPA